MEQQAVERRIAQALNLLLKRDHHLLQVDANERSITHRLALYLEDLFPGWDVDCEYNREGPHPKRVDDLAWELGETAPVDDDQGRTVYPDIVVHRRGEAINLVVIEVKKSSASPAWEKDRHKLELYREDPRLGYQFCVFLVIGVGDESGEVPVFEFILPREGRGRLRPDR